MTQRARRIWVAVSVVVALILLLAFTGIGEGPNRPLEGQAGRDAATWLDGITAVALLLSPFIAVSGVLATIYWANRRESYRQDQERLLARDRQEHERLLKEAELEAARADRLRDERIAAYQKLLTASTKAHTDREAVAELSAAYVLISLLGGTDEIDRAAAEVWVRYGNTQRIADLMNRDPEQASAGDFSQALGRAEAARDRFLALAWEELGVEGRTAGFRDLGSQAAQAAKGEMPLVWAALRGWRFARAGPQGTHRQRRGGPSEQLADAPRTLPRPENGAGRFRRRRRYP
jgi:hypothetical protein